MAEEVTQETESEVLPPLYSGLKEVNRFRLAGHGPSEGILPLELIPYKPKTPLLTTIAGVFGRGTEKLVPRFPNPFLFIRKGDIVLNLAGGKVIVVENEPPTFEAGSAPRGLIAVKNGLAKETVPILDEQRTSHMVTRPASDARINLDLDSFFVREATVTGKDKTKIEIRLKLFGEESRSSIGPKNRNLEELLNKQALVAVETKDGQLVLPKTVFLGELVIVDPKLLAKFLFDNKIYSNPEDVGWGFDDTGKISFKDICWLFVHSTIQKVVSKYTYQELIKIGHEGFINEAVENEVLVEIDRTLGKVGIKRETTTVDLKRFEQQGGDRFRAETVRIPEENPVMSAFLAENAAEVIRKNFGAGPRVTQKEIIRLNPDMTTTENIKVPATVKMYGFPTLVESLYWYPEIPKEERDDGFRDYVERSIFQRYLKDVPSIRNWLRETEEKLENRQFSPENSKLILEELPGAVEWWIKLIEKYKETSVTRKNFGLSQEL